MIAGRLRRAWFVLLLAAASGAGSAREIEARSLVAELEDLRVQVQDGREFAHLDAQSRTALLDASQRALDLVAPVADLSALSTAQRAVLDETLAAIEHQLAEAALDRPRCKPERVTGSNRRVTVCRTRREEQLQREETAKVLLRNRGCVGVNYGQD